MVAGSGILSSTPSLKCRIAWQNSQISAVNRTVIELKFLLSTVPNRVGSNAVEAVPITTLCRWLFSPGMLSLKIVNKRTNNSLILKLEFSFGGNVKPFMSDIWKEPATFVSAVEKNIFF